MRTKVQPLGAMLTPEAAQAMTVADVEKLRAHAAALLALARGLAEMGAIDTEASVVGGHNLPGSLPPQSIASLFRATEALLGIETKEPMVMRRRGAGGARVH